MFTLSVTFSVRFGEVEVVVKDTASSQARDASLKQRPDRSRQDCAQCGGVGSVALAAKNERRFVVEQEIDHQFGGERFKGPA